MDQHPLLRVTILLGILLTIDMRTLIKELKNIFNFYKKKCKNSFTKNIFILISLTNEIQVVFNICLLLPPKKIIQLHQQIERLFILLLF